MQIHLYSPIAQFDFSDLKRSVVIVIRTCGLGTENVGWWVVVFGRVEQTGCGWVAGFQFRRSTGTEGLVYVYITSIKTF